MAISFFFDFHPLPIYSGLIYHPQRFAWPCVSTCASLTRSFTRDTRGFPIFQGLPPLQANLGSLALCSKTVPLRPLAFCRQNDTESSSHIFAAQDFHMPSVAFNDPSGN